MVINVAAFIAIYMNFLVLCTLLSLNQPVLLYIYYLLCFSTLHPSSSQPSHRSTTHSICTSPPSLKSTPTTYISSVKLNHHQKTYVELLELPWKHHQGMTTRMQSQTKNYANYRDHLHKITLPILPHKSPTAANTTRHYQSHQLQPPQDNSAAPTRSTEPKRNTRQLPQDNNNPNPLH